MAAGFEGHAKALAAGGGALLCYTVKVDGMCQRNTHMKVRTQRLPADYCIEMRRSTGSFSFTADRLKNSKRHECSCNLLNHTGPPIYL